VREAGVVSYQPIRLLALTYDRGMTSAVLHLYAGAGVKGRLIGTFNAFNYPRGKTWTFGKDGVLCDAGLTVDIWGAARDVTFVYEYVELCRWPREVEWQLDLYE